MHIFVIEIQEFLKPIHHYKLTAIIIIIRFIVLFYICIS